MNEKKWLRTMGLIAVGLLAAYLLAQILVNLLGSKVFTDPVDLSGADLPDGTAILYEIEDPDLVQVEQAIVQDGNILLSLTPKHSGKVGITFYQADTGEMVAYSYYTVSPFGWITHQTNGNFTHYRISFLLVTILFASFSALLWIGFFLLQQTVRYSYNAIFCCGFGIWMTILSVLLLVNYLQGHDMSYLYAAIQGAAQYFVLFTAPLIVLFAILMPISNLFLIRHEGFSFKNALGIGLSILLVLGLVMLFVVDRLFFSGSELEMRIVSAVTESLHAMYALLECFLIGSIVCGTLAAIHKPAYDKDYLIILGCGIKKDGTLYPLIRGRVDRAIRFYREQLQKTGKQAIFVPSGGQGTDEILSESEAMANYLLSQGIDAAQIRKEDQSRNTRQNMAFSKALIEAEKPDAKVAFSTTNYHVFRSGMISRQVSFQADGMGSRTKWYFWPNAYIREVVGMITYKWKTLLILLVLMVAFFVSVQFLLF